MPTRRQTRSRYSGLTILLLFCSPPASAQTSKEFEHRPIDYHNTATTNRISRLQQLIDSGKRTLAFDERHGYLADLLDALKIPRSSQVLVFSRTSVQIRHISPRHPRAIYFNDDTYIGWVQQSDILEIIAMDPDLGGVFYTLPQSRTDKPQFRRDRGQCLLCHANRRTNEVPGPVVRSLRASAPTTEPAPWPGAAMSTPLDRMMDFGLTDEQRLVRQQRGGRAQSP